MILVDTLLYKIDQRLNKLSTNAHQRIQLEDKILALNEAQIKLIKTKLTGQSAIGQGIGLDSFKKRYEDLENIIVDYGVKGITLTEVNPQIHQFSAPLSELKPDYLFYVDSYVLADKGDCKNHKLWVNKDLVKHGDLSLLLTNEHFKPSFEYQETLCILSKDSISVYSDGTFKPKTIHVSYIKKPKYIDKEGYINFDGTPSIDSDCELESYLEDELLDLTVENLASYTENVNAFQASQYRNKTNE